MHPTQTLILRILKKNGEQTAQQICNEMSGMSVNNIRNALSNLLESGLVTKRSIKESSKPNLVYWKSK